MSREITVIYPAQQVQGVYNQIVETMQFGYPDWAGQMSTPEESVAAMLDTISKSTTKDSGEVVSHLGDKVWLH